MSRLFTDAITAFVFSFLITTASLWAEEGLFTTVSAPAENTEGLFTTVSSPEAPQQAAPAAKPSAPAGVPAPAAKAVPATPAKPEPELEQELLRDPFWPIGYFPKDWNQKKSAGGSAEVPESLWQAAKRGLRISGTSNLGGKTAAIINGELKAAGDQVEVMYEGKTYQWQIIGIDAKGQVQLKKLGIK